MKTVTASISAGTLISLMTAFALVPLPTFDGSPTGLNLVYKIIAVKHISDLSDWVAGLDSIASDKDDNGEAINNIQFEVYLHGGDKPQKYEYNDQDEFRDDMDDWRERRRELKDALNRLNHERGDLAGRRQLMLAQTPVKSFWLHR